MFNFKTCTSFARYLIDFDFISNLKLKKKKLLRNVFGWALMSCFSIRKYILHEKKQNSLNNEYMNSDYRETFKYMFSLDIQYSKNIFQKILINYTNRGFVESLLFKISFKPFQYVKIRRRRSRQKKEPKTTWKSRTRL